MTRDILKEASQALREEGASPVGDPQRTRASIMTGLHSRQRRKNHRLALTIPLAAVLIGGSAWAAASGQLSAAWHEVKVVVGLEANDPAASTPPAPVSQQVSQKPKPAQPKSLPEPLDADSTNESAEPEAEPLPDPVVTPPDPVVTPPQVAAPPASSAPGLAVDDEPLALYRRAHDLHFKTRDAVAALAAWNAYLSEAPSGRLHVEARYNRALCLVRLGRTAEARSALEPFASGRYGNYRQAEAKALLGALEDDPSHPR